MSINNKNIKIPYSIIKHLAGLLEGQQDKDLNDLYIYLLGKAIQVELREEYDPNNKDLMQKYSNNKKLIDELEQKIRNSVLNTNL